MKIILSLAFFFITTIVQAQHSTYLADLDALRAILQKTPSYKAQVKGNRLAAYDTLYNELAADTTAALGSYHYFFNLARLFFPLRDNHLGFYQLANWDHFRNKDSIARYVTTQEFASYPKYDINIDSLKNELAKKPADSIEGIYHYGKFYSVGLFKSTPKEYIGVIVNSNINLWVKGQVAIHLYAYAPGLYKAIYGHPLSKNFMLQTSEKYRDGALLNSYFYASYSQSIYTKQLQETGYVNLPRGGARFALQNINDSVQYLLVKSFQVNNATMAASASFCDSVKNVLTAPYLILDLRNNEGGAERAAGKYLRLLEHYTAGGKLYVLVNNETLSQAEILLLRLKVLRNVTVAGQTTKGMLTYGSNYGRRKRLPGGSYEVYITDMSGPDRLLQYEDYGIAPDIYLDDKSDWIDQLLRVIGR